MKVKKEMLLMDYLLLSYNRKNAKNLLKYKQVYVNNQQISQFDYLLHENDQVEIKKENTSSLEILYEDQEFVVINKPSGLLSMSDGKEKEKTAYHYVSEYLKKQDRKQKSINIGNTFIGIVISLLVVLLAVISFISWWVACLIYILESILVLLNSQNIVRM